MPSEPLSSFDIAVVGPIPKDYVRTPSTVLPPRYGCVVHATAALSSLVSDRGNIYPVSHVRTEDLDAVRRLLSNMPGVRTEFVTGEGDQGAVIEVEFGDESGITWTERQRGFMKPIDALTLESLTGIDAFVFIPVTDYEVSFDVLRRLRDLSEAVIVFDAHGPTMTCTRDLVRRRTFWRDYKRWMPLIDVLKMNEVEAGCLGTNVSTLPLDKPMAAAQRAELAHRCFEGETSRLSAVCITLAEKGAEIYVRNPNGAIERHHCNSVPSTGEYRVGCGDAFAGGFTFGFLATRDLVMACRYGNAIGSQRCSDDSDNPFLGLAATVQQIKAAALG